MDCLIYKILLIDSLETNYHHIFKILQQSEICKFNLNWAKNHDEALVKRADCDYDGYLINYQEKNLLSWVQTVTPTPVIALINNDQNIDINLLENGLSDYLKYEQLNPVILEHCLRLVIEHSQSQTKKKNSQTENQDKLKIRTTQEQELNQTEDLLNSIFENSENGILIIDRLGIIHFVNQTGSKLLNKPLHKLIGYDFGLPIVNNNTTHMEIINSENQITTLEMSVAETKWQKQPASVVIIRDISREIEYKKSLYETKEKYETILKTTSEGFFIIDTFNNIGKILEVNDAYCQMIGYSREELLTMSISDIKIIETPATVNQYIEKIIQEKSDRFEGKHRRKDGQIINVLISVNYLPEFNYFYSFITDITERKQMELALKKSEYRYSNLAEAVQVGLYINDPEGNCVYINQKCSELLNITLAECLGTGWINRIHPDDLERMLKHWQECFKNKTYWEDEYRFIHPDGKNVWVYAQAVFQFNEKGENTGSIGCLTDITERKILEQELEKNQRIFQDLASNLPGAIFRYIVYPDGSDEVIYISHGCENIWEFTTQEITENISLLWNVIHPDDVSAMKESIALSAEKLEPWSLEWRIITRSGKEKWLQGIGQPRLEENGELIWNSLIMDITDRKKTEEALEKSEASFRSIFENAAIGIAIVDLNGYCFRVNHKFSEFLGYPKEELLQINFKTISHPEDLSITKKYFQESLNGIRDYFSFDKRFICKTGIVKWGNITVTLVKNIDNKPKHFIVVIDDISIRKEAQIALEQAKQAAEEANLAKSQFLANMSHELRTPLNAILGFTQLMARSNQLIPQHQEYLQIINRAGEHLLSLINDILDLSRIEAGKIELDQEIFDLHDLLDSVQKMLEIKAKAKNLALIFEIDQQLNHYLKIDPKKLRSVLINIIGNAIKFTNQGRVILRVKTNQQSDNQVNLLFEIEDTGIGISPEEIPTLFDVFVQAKSGKQSGEGSGLGLAITQRFINLMGGEITVKSKLNQGTIFAFNIICDLDKDNYNVPISLPSSVISIKTNQPEYRILIVEDKPINRQFLVDLLSSTGFNIQNASNGQEAIQMWQTWHPDLILMDIRMPIMDGYQAIQEIRNLETQQHIPNPVKIIAVTASVLAHEKELILQAGCNDFIGKPIKEAEVFAKIAHYLGVSYIYNSVPTSETVSLSQSPNQLNPDDLLIMPYTWREKLYKAAIAARTKKILQLINDIPVNNKATIDGLTLMVQQLNFEEIINLTQISE